MKKYKKEVSTNFTLEGQFLGFVIDQDDNKFKYLRMVVADDEVQIKLSKQARASLFRSLEEHSFLALRPWDLIRVTGEKTLDRTTGELKLKAEQIIILQDNKPIDVNCKISTHCQNQAKKSSKSSAKLLVCHRSSCQKRGGRRQHQAIESILRDRGLHECVAIEKSGCLGKCSMAPNIILMPGKKRLSGMNPDAIAELLISLNLND